MINYVGTACGALLTIAILIVGIAVIFSRSPATRRTSGPTNDSVGYILSCFDDDNSVEGDKMTSNLVEHARTELTLVGEEPETIEGYLKVIQAFADMDHSGGSASVAIPVIHQLLQFKHLTPLTDDPEEWHNHGPEMWDGVHHIWQNRRNGEAFSNDGGKTYYLLSEGGSARNPKPMHTSVISGKGQLA